MKNDVTCTIYGLTDGEVRALYYLLEGYRADVELKPAPMTDEEYVRNGAGRCPLCRSPMIEIEPGSEGSEGTGSWQTVRCPDCGARWDEIFEMIGYELKEES